LKGASHTHEDSGLLLLSEGTARFTLYRPEAEAHRHRTLVILAADAQAAHPHPLRLLAEALAGSGLTTVYVEPTNRPAEAAARLKAVLRRQADKLGIDTESIYSWVEGSGLGGPAESPCRNRRLLQASLAWLTHDVHARSPLVQRAFDWAVGGVGCSPLGRP
jgi:hypothetical protein